jgi:hypothetical protein
MIKRWPSCFHHRHAEDRDWLASAARSDPDEESGAMNR